MVSDPVDSLAPKPLTSFAEGLRRVIEVLVVGMFACFTVVVLLGVWFRYVANDSLFWSEEFIRFCLFYMVMIGVALVSYDDAHIRIDTIHRYLPARVSRALQLVAHLCSLGFQAILVWQSIELFHRAITTSEALRIPMRYIYLAPIIGGGLMFFYTLLVVLQRRRGQGAVL